MNLKNFSFAFLTKLLIQLLLVVFSFSICNAQIPSGYYNTATGTGATLKTALYNIINNHTVRTYDNLWTDFQTTDINANGKVWDMYSNCTFTFVSDQDNGTGGTAECQKFNREHSFPKSWFGGAVAPMYTDLFHLIPSDKFVNNARGNYAYGQVTNASQIFINGGKIGPNTYGGVFAGDVFEPANEYKGDLARNYFYMVTCYENQVASWESNDPNGNAFLNGTSYPCFETWALNMLLAWNTLDPVSQKEINRNNAVYAIQGNRNPYIDHPEYVAMVWAPSSLSAEPSNYPANFSAHNIHLQWADATGTVLPQHYLIRMSSVGFASIATPVDGISYPDDASNKNVSSGLQSAWFTNLTPSTTYYFKLFGYSGSGAGCDYKTDGSVPQISKVAN
ncbi:MAG: endonuclease [Bacteroidota bacterium]